MAAIRRLGCQAIKVFRASFSDHFHALSVSGAHEVAKRYCHCRQSEADAAILPPSHCGRTDSLHPRCHGQPSIDDPVETGVAQAHEAAIAAGDLLSPPSFVPGDRTVLQNIGPFSFP
jgi:hypothetical protein